MGWGGSAGLYYRLKRIPIRSRPYAGKEEFRFCPYFVERYARNWAKDLSISRRP